MTFTAHARLKMVAAADPREEARRQCERNFRGRTYASLETMCADPNLYAIQIATPHQLPQPRSP